MKKLKFLLSLAVSVIIGAALFPMGCGDDTVTPPPPGGNPTINMQVGSVYTLNVDSIPQSGTPRHTAFKSTMTFLSQSTFFGQANAFQIRAVTRDSLNLGPSVIDTFYVRYDGGKFYQYGTLQLIDPNIPATWDLVADFTVATGTEWTIASDVPIPLFPGLTATITGKVAEETSFRTYGFDSLTVHCYRSEIKAVLNPGAIATIYLDYFIGDANPSTNPSGLVRLRLRPFTVLIQSYDGFDQSMQIWTTP